MSRGCGAYTQPRSGKIDAYPLCEACRPSKRPRALAGAKTGRNQPQNPTNEEGRLGPVKTQKVLEMPRSTVACQRLCKQEVRGSNPVGSIRETPADQAMEASGPDRLHPTPEARRALTVPQGPARPLP